MKTWEINLECSNDIKAPVGGSLHTHNLYVITCMPPVIKVCVPVMCFFMTKMQTVKCEVFYLKLYFTYYLFRVIIFTVTNN